MRSALRTSPLCRVPPPGSPGRCRRLRRIVFGRPLAPSRGIRRSWHRTATVAAALALAALPSTLHAQRSITHGAWAVGTSVGFGFQLAGPVADFSRRLCPGDEQMLEGRAGLWLNARKGFVLSVARHAETGDGSCQSRRLAAPPDSGRVTYLDDAAVQGYPYGSATVRMVLGAGSPSGLGTHGFIGAQWLWGKAIVAPLLGMGVNLSPWGTTILIEGQGRLLTIPTEVVTAEFRRGQAVAVERREGSRQRAHMAVRVAVDLPLRSLLP